MRIERRWVDAPLDRLRFALDRFPGSGYQPLPWLGMRRATRIVGIESRLEAVQALLAERRARTVLDVGCNAGFYTISLALQGYAAVGLEADPRYVRLFTHAVDRMDLSGRVGVLRLVLDPETAGLVPHADVTLFLAVWHHLVRAHGLDGADQVLEALWGATGDVLLFETGEAEMPEGYGLPSGLRASPLEFLTEYLEQRCPGGTVLHLGVHEARPYGRIVPRNLFAVVR